MGVFYNGRGIIRLNGEENDFFTNGLKALLEIDASDEYERFMCNDEGLAQFRFYARYGLMAECVDFVKDNLNLVREGRLNFACDEADGSVESPFPCYISYEIVDGEIYEQILYTRMPFDWEYHNGDIDWFCQKIHLQ